MGDWKVIVLRPTKVLLYVNLAMASAVFGAEALWVGPVMATDLTAGVVRLVTYWELPLMGAAFSLVYFVGAFLERR